MRDTRACRACLNTQGKLENIPDSWYRLFASLTGIQVSKSDGYPNYFCIECKSHMNKAIAFRKKSRRAFFVLKEIMIVKKEVNLSDILTLNRSTANLESVLGIWKPEKIRRYTMLENVAEGGHSLEALHWDVVTSNVVIDVKQSEHPPPEEPDIDPKNALQIDFVDNDHNYSQGDEAQEHTLEEAREPDSDIDMEDIFKGLQEPESEKSDEEVEKIEKIEKIKKRKKRLPAMIVSGENMYRKVFTGVASALASFELTKLTPEQQKEGFKIRLEKPEIMKALYSCSVCVEVFTEWRFLKEHFNVHMKKNDCNLVCEICEDKCPNEDNLLIHMSENHMYKYTCKICQEELYALKDALRHKPLHTVTKEPPASTIELLDKFHFIPVPEEDMKENFRRLSRSGAYSCDECGMSFSAKSQLSLHVGKHRVPIGSRSCVCSVCGVGYYTEELWKNHMESYHYYTFQCKQCSYEAQNRHLAEYHMRRVHSESCICQYCGVSFKHRKALSEHSVSRHAACGRSFRKLSLLYSHQHRKALNEHSVMRHAALRHACAACGRSFRKLSLLYSHQFREHTILHLAEPPTGDGTNACMQCNVQFLSERAYHNHLLLAGHDEANDLPWKCLLCKTLFDTEEESKEHETRCPLKKFPAPCSLCGIMVNSHREYLRHCKATHPNYTSIVSYKRKLCDSCGKTYAYKCTCQMEPVKTKTSVYKYKCASCEIGFNKALDVIYHVLNVHMDKPFVCNICAKAFKSRWKCKDHILKIHAPARPYGCPICNRMFSHIDFLRAHATKNHQVKLALENNKEKHKKFCLYPNMKVDLSLVDTRIIKSAKIYVADYTNQIYENIENYSDYIITSEDVKRKSDAVVQEEL